jgi:hypothetical protein
VAESWQGCRAKAVICGGHLSTERLFRRQCQCEAVASNARGFLLGIRRLFNTVGAVASDSGLWLRAAGPANGQWRGGSLAKHNGSQRLARGRNSRLPVAASGGRTVQRAARDSIVRCRFSLSNAASCWRWRSMWLSSVTQPQRPVVDTWRSSEKGAQTAAPQQKEEKSQEEGHDLQSTRERRRLLCFLRVHDRHWAATNPPPSSPPNSTATSPSASLMARCPQSPIAVGRSAKSGPSCQPASRHQAGSGLSIALFGIGSGLWQAALLLTGLRARLRGGLQSHRRLG